MQASDMDILKIILSSGLVVKVVLISLIFASVLSWSIVILKFLSYKRIQIQNENFLSFYKGGASLKEINEKARSIEYGAYSLLYIEGYEEILKLKQRFSSHQNPFESLDKHMSIHGLSVVERGMKKASNSINLELERFLSVLASVGSVTPFVGLFGTVWGIIHSFTGLTSGNSTLSAVAPGIAEALVATAAGLFAAIPAVLFYNYFSNKNQKMNFEIETFGHDFLNLIERSLISKKG